MENRTEKNSFLLYADSWEFIRELSIENRGILLSAIYAYVRGEDLPDMDEVTRLAFIVIKVHLDRDFKAYCDKIEKRSQAGKQGGRPRKNQQPEPEEEKEELEEKQTKAKKANAFSEKQTKAKKADIDIDSDNDIDSDIESESDIYIAPTPTKDAFVCYAESIGMPKDKAERIFYQYESTGWKTKAGSPIVDWEKKLQAIQAEDNAKEKAAIRPDKQNKFNNFTQREYDYNDLERKLLNA